MRWPEGPAAPPQTHTLEALIIAAGTVIAINNTGFTLVRHRRAFLYVAWFANALPPAVKIGARVGFIGKVRTFNNGLRAQVWDALLLQKPPKSILNALMKFIPDAVLNPGEYLTDTEIEEMTQP